MKKFKARKAVETLVSDLVYTAAAVAQEPELNLAEGFEQQIQEGDKLDNQARVLKRELAHNRAAVVSADLFLERAERSMQLETLVLTKGDRKALVFKQLYPHDIGTLTRYALPRQIELAKAQHLALGTELYPTEFRERHQAALAQGIERGEMALKARAALANREAELKVATELWRQEVQLFRQSAYGQALIWAAARGEERSVVERFFELVSERDDDDDDEPTPEV